MKVLCHLVKVKVLCHAAKVKLENLGNLAAEDIISKDDETQEEFSVLDRAGRIQIPREILEDMGINGNKVRIEYKDGQLIVTNPEKN